MPDFLNLEKSVSFDVYAKLNIVLTDGKNANLRDSAGNSYIDGVSGHGVSNLGHGNPDIIEAIQKQAKRLITCSNLFYNDQRAILLEKLIHITPKNLVRAFLCNSGAESIEAAIKFTRFTTQKTDFICMEKAFHGRTLGAVSATFKPEYKDGFGPLVPGFSFVPFNDFEKLEQAVTEKTAGVIVELVQGEGGIKVVKRNYLHQIRKLCDEKGIILIVDEIQSGFCRTGKMFACEHFGVEPDILCLAKAIAGGLPMGAVVCSDRLEVPLGKHGTTFGGNPLACAAANAAIGFMLTQKLHLQAEEKGVYLREKLELQPLSKIKEIRGLGLMLGIELVQDVRPVITSLIEDGLLTFPAGQNVIRVFPPLTIEYETLDVVAEKLVAHLH